MMTIGAFCMSGVEVNDQRHDCLECSSLLEIHPTGRELSAQQVLGVLTWYFFGCLEVWTTFDFEATTELCFQACFHSR